MAARRKIELDWEDVDLSRRLLRIQKAQGGRQRTIPIHPALAPLFAEYYAARAPLANQALFVGVQGAASTTPGSARSSAVTSTPPE